MILPTPQVLRRKNWRCFDGFATKSERFSRPTRPDVKTKQTGTTNSMKNSAPKTPEEVRQAVRAGYSQIAKGGGSCCGSTPGSCGATPAGSAKLARQVGYSADELAALPDGANMGLSCGNPNALAALKPGEVVLDLGSGGGFDVFIAARKVGAAGRGIGVDMTPEMLAKARKN